MHPRIQFAWAKKAFYDNNGRPVDSQWRATQSSISLRRVSESIDLNNKQNLFDTHQIDPDTESLAVCVGRRQGDIDSFRQTFGITGDLIPIAPTEFPEEESAISRNHFMFERFRGAWTLSRGSKRGAEVKLQRWGRSRVETLEPGTKIGLQEGDRLSCWSEIGGKYFWILVQMTGDGQTEPLGSTGESGSDLRITDGVPTIDLDVSIDGLNRAREAVTFRFSEFLSWPMHPHPDVRALSKSNITQLRRWFNDDTIDENRIESLKTSLKTFSERLYDARCEAGEEPKRVKQATGTVLLDELTENDQLIPFILGPEQGDNVLQHGFDAINIPFHKRMDSPIS